MKKYSIGQVIYVVDPGPGSGGRIRPMQVVEELTKRTLHGEDVNYIVAFGVGDGSRHRLDEVKGEVFDGPEAVRRALIERSQTAIEHMVNAAVANADNWYGSTNPSTNPVRTEAPVHEPMPVDATLLPEAGQLVELPGGVKARVRTVKAADPK